MCGEMCTYIWKIDNLNVCHPHSCIYLDGMTSELPSTQLLTLTFASLPSGTLEDANGRLISMVFKDLLTFQYTGANIHRSLNISQENQRH